jgi:hypothetical protein
MKPNCFICRILHRGRHSKRFFHMIHWESIAIKNVSFNIELAVLSVILYVKIAMMIHFCTDVTKL